MSGGVIVSGSGLLVPRITLPLTFPWFVIDTLGAPANVTLKVWEVVLRTRLQLASTYPLVGIAIVTDPDSVPSAAEAAMPVGVPVKVPSVGAFTNPETDPQDAELTNGTTKEPLAVEPESVPSVGTETEPLIAPQVAVS